MKPEQVIVEARARILWGESAASVREWLISNGLSVTEADGKIKEFTAERVTELRRLGIKNMVIGVAIWAGGTLTLYPLFRYFDSLSHIRRPVFIGLFGVVGFCGLWRLIRGIGYLARPRSEERSLTELSE